MTSWSPQGRLFQVEYAMEAVKQGAVCVGVASATHVVIAALNLWASIEIMRQSRKELRQAAT